MGVIDIETLQYIIEIINTVGFPIACVCALIKLLMDEMKTHREESTETLKAINNNSVIMQQLSDKIDQLMDGDEK